MFAAAFISFFGITLLFSHLGKKWFRRAVGYKGILDLFLHGTILYMFMGTSTMGLLQAEAAGIMFSLFLRGYSWACGCERLINWKWERIPGRIA